MSGLRIQILVVVWVGYQLVVGIIVGKFTGLLVLDGQ
jgi:hypothetical protein